MSSRSYTIRIITLIALLILISGIGIRLLYDFFSLRDFTLLKLIVFFLFSVLFLYVGYGTSNAILGFFKKITGGDRLRISKTLDALEEIPIEVSTAIVMPIYEEDVDSVFSRIEVMYTSMQSHANSSSYDFFVLSDTRNLDKWIAEEERYIRLCKKLDAFGKIFYRRRKINLNKKSGNLADFCRRWGRKYKYMVVLDADSLITTDCIIKLTKLMELNPNTGIIQTYPKVIEADTFYQKIMQFTSAVHGDIFSIGANYWQLSSSSFWGHNAIIRLKPFMDYCGLPHLPKFGAIGGRIMSHDTIEAALILKEGYSVWSAYDLEGSYEESPPGLIDSLKRDERWCLGNLQHFWFLFAKGLKFSSRIHIFLGIFSYLASFIWLLFIIATIFLYMEDLRFFRLSMEPEEWKIFWSSIYFQKSLNLFIYTYTVLFFPRILTLFDTILFMNYKKYCSSVMKFMLTYALEFIFSVFQAPILMFMHSKFILFTLLGKKNEWKNQNRSAENVPSLNEVVLIFYPLAFLGLCIGIYFYFFIKTLFYLLIPIWFAWMISPLIVYLSGLKFSSVILFIDREKAEFTKEVSLLKRLLTKLNTTAPHITQVIEIFFLVAVDPFYNSMHCLFHKYKAVLNGKKRENAETIIQKALIGGPAALTKNEMTLILNDSRLLRKLYYTFWSSNIQSIHAFWQKNLRKYKAYL